MNINNLWKVGKCRSKETRLRSLKDYLTDFQIIYLPIPMLPSGLLLFVIDFRQIPKEGNSG